MIEDLVKHMSERQHWMGFYVLEWASLAPLYMRKVVHTKFTGFPQGPGMGEWDPGYKEVVEYKLERELSEEPTWDKRYNTTVGSH